MRVVFMGTPDFAVPSLRALANRFDVVAVYSRPDSASGRGGRLRPSAVTAAAGALGLPVAQPSTLRDPSILESLAASEPDVLCVAAYGLILPQDVLDVARLGAVNVHASLLPRWRGAAPIQRAILAGDDETGVSIMRMEAGLDTGAYCAQLRTTIAEKTAAELTAELAELGATALVDALPRIADGSATWTAQDESLVTYAEKVTKGECAPDPALCAGDNVVRVRASLPAAPSRILIAGRGVTLLDARLTPEAVVQGRIRCEKSAVLLGARDAAFEVRSVKPDGKAAMDAAAWCRGARDVDGTVWACAR